MRRVIFGLLMLSFLQAHAQTPAWTAMGAGLNNSGNALFIWNGTLYAGGAFTVAGNANALHIAKWTGLNWQPLGAGFDAVVTCMAVYNNELYAGGYFNLSGTSLRKHIAKWNGTSWDDVGGGITGFSVEDMIEYNGKLYVTGNFNQAGTVTASKIAAWDGVNWSAVGNYGISTASYCRGVCLEVFDNKLYVGGIMDTVENMAVGHLATWDGSSWGTANMGLNDPVFALEAYDGLLYAGGYFTATWYGDLMMRLASWDGNIWSACGDGFNDGVETLYGYGSLLYVGGWFGSSATVPSAHLVTWDGGSFASIGEPSDAVLAVCADEGIVYATGIFTSVGTVNVNRVAKYAAPGVGICNVRPPLTFSLFPNPSRGLLKFTVSENSDSLLLEIYSSNGMLVRRIQFRNSTLVDMSDESHGIYHCHLRSEKGELYAGSFVLE